MRTCQWVRACASDRTVPDLLDDLGSQLLRWRLSPAASLGLSWREPDLSQPLPREHLMVRRGLIEGSPCKAELARASFGSAASASFVAQKGVVKPARTT